jgi:hypothetical protein
MHEVYDSQQPDKRTDTLAFVRLASRLELLPDARLRGEGCQAGSGAISGEFFRGRGGLDSAELAKGVSSNSRVQMRRFSPYEASNADLQR